MTSARHILLAAGSAALLSACTTKTENYCDGATPCAAGARCDLIARRCVEPWRPDASVPQQADSGPTRPDSAIGRADTAPGSEGLSPTREAGQPAEAGQPTEAGQPGAIACTDDSACPSGFCVDGFCCATACPGPCRSCAVPGQEGQCKPVATGQDPRQDCAPSGTDCAGRCNGSGACAFPDATQSCGAKSCAAGQLSTGACDTQGACVVTKQSCGGLACADAATCKTSCSQDGDCLGSDMACISGACTAVKPNGAPCGSNGKLCQSGFCVDGLCCNSACGGACQACNLPGKSGTCSAEPDGTSCGSDACAADVFTVQACQAGGCKATKAPCFPYACAKSAPACAQACASAADCAPGAYCTATGKCQPKKNNGVPCGSSSECTSALCTQKEKVCCNAECGGDCESCAGKTQCLAFPADDPCGPGNACQNEASESFISVWSCNGSAGTCQQQKTSCQGFKCGAGLTCLSSCTKHQDCVSGVCELWGSKSCVAVTAVCHVDAQATAPGQGTVTAPHRTISSCLAKKAATVAVADGTYDEDLHFSSSTLLVAKNASSVPGAAPQVVLRPVSQGLRIDAFASVKLHAVEVQGHAGASAVAALLTASGPLELSSVRLKNAQGSALVLGTASAHLEDVRIEGAKGIGLDATAPNLDLQRVTISKSGGMGLRASGGSLKAQDLRIFDAGSVGLYSSSALDLRDVRIQGSDSVGLWLLGGSSGKIVNALITHSGTYGITAYDGAVTVSYATVTQNNGSGTQLWCVASSVGPALKNSVVWSGLGKAIAGSTKCSFEGSDYDEASGGNNYAADPRFVSPLLPTGTYSCIEYDCVDYRLQPTSPCIDHGVTLAAAYAPAQDLLGHPRVHGAKGDSGAYEHQGTVLGP